MSLFNINTDEAIQSLLGFNQRLGEGLQTLADIGEVHTGTAPREAVYHEDKLVLYRYQPVVKKPSAIPLLIVYALVNRPYMVDLQEDRSMVRGLLATGQDVYLIDWGYPDKADRYLTLDDYINGYLHRCVNTICRRHGTNSINLLGICQGGVFSLCYSALHSSQVRNLITMVTPVDFHTPDNLLNHLVRKLDVDQLVDTMGNIPGELLNWMFLSLKPFRLGSHKYMEMVTELKDTEKTRNFLRMERWINDSPDQAGEAFRQFIQDFFQNNGLIKNKVIIGDSRVRLRDIKMPLLNIFATADHLVPPSASIPLKKHISSTDYTALPFKGGHIGIYVSHRAQQEIPVQIGRWLDDRNDQ